MKINLLTACLMLILFTSVNAQYISSTTDQVSAPYLNQGTVDNPIIRLRIDLGPSGGVLNSLLFDHNGSTNPSMDIQMAKVYYTGSSNVFSTAVQYGSSWTNFPVSSFNFTSSLTLAAGTNYLWLSYDLKSSAICNDYVDAACNSLSIGSIAFIPSTSNPTGSAIVCGTTGISNLQPLTSNLQISPNPATDKITISFAATVNENVTIKMYNITGEVVYEEKKKSIKQVSIFEFQVSGFPNGIYFLSVQTEKDFFTKKIVVQH